MASDSTLIQALRNAANDSNRQVVESIINSPVEIRWVGGSTSYYVDGAIYIGRSLNPSQYASVLAHEYGHHVFKNYQQAELNAAYQTKDLVAGVDAFALKEAIAVAYEYTTGVSGTMSTYVDRAIVESTYLQVANNLAPGATYDQLMQTFAQELSAYILGAHVSELVDRTLNWFSKPPAPFGSSVNYNYHGVTQVSFQGESFAMSDYQYADLTTLNMLGHELFSNSSYASGSLAELNIEYITYSGSIVQSAIWAPQPADLSSAALVENIAVFVGSVAAHAENNTLGNIYDSWSYTFSPGWNEAERALNEYYSAIYGSDPNGKWIRTPYYQEVQRGASPFESDLDGISQVQDLLKHPGTTIDSSAEALVNAAAIFSPSIRDGHPSYQISATSLSDALNVSAAAIA